MDWEVHVRIGGAIGAGAAVGTLAGIYADTLAERRQASAVPVRISVALSSIVSNCESRRLVLLLVLRDGKALFSKGTVVRVGVLLFGGGEWSAELTESAGIV